MITTPVFVVKENTRTQLLRIIGHRQRGYVKAIANTTGKKLYQDKTQNKQQISNNPSRDQTISLSSITVR